MEKQLRNWIAGITGISLILFAVLIFMKPSGTEFLPLEIQVGHVFAIVILFAGILFLELAREK